MSMNEQLSKYEANKKVSAKEFCDKNMEDRCDRNTQSICEHTSKKGCEDLKKKCEIEVRNQLEEECKEKREKEYADKCDKDLPGKCKTTWSRNCENLKKKCEEDSKNDKEQDIRDRCIIKYLEVGDKGKLYIKDVLYKFYPELIGNKDIINKVENGTYSVKQFGMSIKDNSDNGGSNDYSVTYRKNIDQSCLDMSRSNTIIESYSIKDNCTVKCCNQVLDDVKRDNDNTHIQIVKAAKDHSNIDKYLPVVTVSQKQPLIIANVSNGNLIKKDGTVTNIKFEKYKEFSDNSGRITDCKDKGEECNTCRDLMYDFSEEVPVYCALSS